MGGIHSIPHQMTHALAPAQLGEALEYIPFGLNGSQVVVFLFLSLFRLSPLTVDLPKNKVDFFIYLNYVVP